MAVLLQRGADTERQNDRGQTALGAAAFGGRRAASSCCWTPVPIPRAVRRAHSTSPGSSSWTTCSPCSRQPDHEPGRRHGGSGPDRRLRAPDPGRDGGTRRARRCRHGAALAQARAAAALRLVQGPRRVQPGAQRARTPGTCPPVGWWRPPAATPGWPSRTPPAWSASRPRSTCPTTAPAVKVARLAALGARVVQEGTEYAHAQESALASAAASGALFCHAYDQPEICAGQGTLGLELAEQVPDVDTVVLAVGGGGLMAGVATALAGRARVVGVEPETIPTLHAALAAGEPVDVDGQRCRGRLAGRPAARVDRLRGGDGVRGPQRPGQRHGDRRRRGHGCGASAGSSSSTAARPRSRRWSRAPTGRPPANGSRSCCAAATRTRGTSDERRRGGIEARIEARIEALVVSPGHNYWFHSSDPADGVGPHPTSYPDESSSSPARASSGTGSTPRRPGSPRRSASSPPRRWRRSRTSSAWPAARSTRG